MISLKPNNHVKRKKVISHRGACGYLPEHTLEAYAMAYGMGTDFVEPDLVLSKDAVFICSHNIYLELTTNVSDIFPDKCREDGHWYAIDLKLSEIKELHVHERINKNGTAVFPGRFPLDKALFKVPTFNELIELIQGLNKASKQDVGLFPEIKNPSWHTAEGLPMENLLISTLTQYGYTDENALLYIQCIEPKTLKNLRFNMKTKLPLIQIIGLDECFNEMISENGLRNIATYANGIAPHKQHIEDNPVLVKRAHEMGLKVYPWVFRADQLSVRYKSFKDELNQFYSSFDIDGLFTDFPDQAVELIESTKGY